MEECSSQATGTIFLNESHQHSMAMEGTSMALNDIKIDQGTYSHLMFDSYHLCYVLLGLPGLFSYLQCDLHISSDQHHPHSLVLMMPRDKGKPRNSTRNKNSFTQDNRLTASQRALISHFSQPRRPSSKFQSTLHIPKEENPPTSSQTQAQPPLHILKSETFSPTKISPQPSHITSAFPNTTKEEALMSPQHSSMKVEEVEPPPQPGLSLVQLQGSPRTLIPSTSHDF
jgi:hypothetical protein